MCAVRVLKRRSRRRPAEGSLIRLLNIFGLGIVIASVLATIGIVMLSSKVDFVK